MNRIYEEKESVCEIFLLLKTFIGDNDGLIMSHSDIMEHTGYCPKTIREAISRLIDIGLVNKNNVCGKVIYSIGNKLNENLQCVPNGGVLNVVLFVRDGSQ